MITLPLNDLSDPPPDSLVVVALSGGVDSSLTVQLLKERGCRVIAVTILVYPGGPMAGEAALGSCFEAGQEKNLKACQRFCRSLDLPYHIIDLSKAYSQLVLDYFRAAYRQGRTPNPCIRCNPLIKFGLLPETLRQQGIKFDYLATGHYARLATTKIAGQETLFLRPAKDDRKDQSYFLYRLSKQQLTEVRFPLGTMTKAEVRKQARLRGLEAASSLESQDFLGSGGYHSLFDDQAARSGDFVDRTGQKLGRHLGLERYTIGQRRGLGIASASGAWYVVELDPENNRVVLGHDDELFADGLEASDALWATGFGTEPFEALVKIRSTASPAQARVTPLAGGKLRLDFSEAQRAVAPGQSAVLYAAVPGSKAWPPTSQANCLEHLVVAGGAIIERAFTRDNL